VRRHPALCWAHLCGQRCTAPLLCARVPSYTRLTRCLPVRAFSSRAAGLWRPPSRSLKKWSRRALPGPPRPAARARK